MSAPDKDITMPAAALARAAPREWEEFMAGMKKYAEARAILLVQASRDDLEKSQGRAQQCTLLVALFDDAKTAADRVQAQAANSSKK